MFDNFYFNIDRSYQFDCRTYITLVLGFKHVLYAPSCICIFHIKNKVLYKLFINYLKTKQLISQLNNYFLLGFNKIENKFRRNYSKILIFETN